MNNSYKTTELRKSMLYDGFPVMEYNIKYPFFKLSDGKGEKRINRYYERYTEKLKHYCEKTFFDISCAGYRQNIRENTYPASVKISVDFNVTRFDNMLICVMFTQRILWGTERPVVVHISDIWDITGIPVMADELFSSKRKSKKLLTEKYLIQSNIRNDSQTYPKLKLKKLVRNIEKQCIEIGEKTIDLICGYGETRRFSDDCVRFSCPVEILNEILNPLYFTVARQNRE